MCDIRRLIITWIYLNKIFFTVKYKIKVLMKYYFICSRNIVTLNFILLV